MRSVDGRFQLSASDLVNHLACRHLTVWTVDRMNQVGLSGQGNRILTSLRKGPV